MIATDCIEALERAAARYRRELAEAHDSREDLYALIVESSELLTVREIARATNLSPGRVNQIQHGR